jgi:hypothetical protein
LKRPWSVRQRSHCFSIVLCGQIPISTQLPTEVFPLKVHTWSQDENDFIEQLCLNCNSLIITTKSSIAVSIVNSRSWINVLTKKSYCIKSSILGNKIGNSKINADI